MKQSLEMNGDPIERTNFPFLGRTFPSYVRIWETFIGNDGLSELPVLQGVDPADLQLRSKVNQWSYTAVESAIVAERCATSLYNIWDQFKPTDSLSVDAYVTLSADLFAFYGHLGRIHDAIEKLGYAVRLKELHYPLGEYYAQRNSVLHEARLPMMIGRGMLGIVPPAGRDDSVDSWQKNQLWSTKDRLQVKDLGPCVRETADKAFALTETAFGLVMGVLSGAAGKSIRIALENSEVQPAQSFVPSGSIVL